jgi:hypothetical protein
MNATAVAWLVCGIVLAGTFTWPYVKEFEAAAWDVHYDTCSKRHERNRELLRMKVCDNGENELAHLDTVNCAKARAENLWGVWVCTVSLRFQTHTATEIWKDIWSSWYSWFFLLFVTYVVIRHWLHGRAEVQKHAIAMKHTSDAFSAAMAATAQHRIGYPPQRQLPAPAAATTYQHQERRVYFNDT